ncbi:TetR/AcrR family transcriptional regulator [Kibdelosporangium persicum]|uniref:HTH-type transcriptional regulator MtrR n=1 Tax=Kibdelosporangium persicum TaxID=2698649 RepID=A0ABX2EV66_9PSEU|nr:TetR/AcrR family transcriptional regulator [Kibdelosporangium persicum]NRN62869.1 HTH-type transcriptional regulator MtrR [Kibdelosporangium persicum]
MPRKPDPGARERILETACRLFDAHGVHAVGMQQIIDEVGCGKNLLYREFQTKDDLVAAYVERGKQAWLLDLRAVAERIEAPADQLLGIVSRIAENATAPGFRGCTIYNTHAEFPEPDHPVNRAATRNLEFIRDSLFDLAKRAGAADPRTLADRLLLIIDGVKANGAAMGRSGAASVAVAFAEETIRTALRPIGTPSGS